MKTITYNVKIITKTGLHIGSGNAGIEIGGMDQPVIKDKDGYPYIPASSLKGKLRSLYETNNSMIGRDYKDEKTGKIKNDGGPYEYINGEYDEVSMFFGKAGNVKNNLDNLGPTRFIFRDLRLKENLDEDEKNKGFLSKKELDELKTSGGMFEEKIEVSIDRFTGTASKSGPRPLERVPAGVIFEGKLIVRLFEKKEILSQYSVESEEEILTQKFGNNLEILKKLIENDYLGGGGSRGSGEVEVEFSLEQ